MNGVLWGGTGFLEGGVETTIEPGDFFEIPHAHDALVDGDDQVEPILFVPPEHPHGAGWPYTSQVSFPPTSGHERG